MNLFAAAVNPAMLYELKGTLHNTHRTLQLSLFLLFASTLSNANPISVPEIVSKSGKNIGGTSSSASLMIKPSIQNAQLNSLNAYATNYGHFAAQIPNNGAEQTHTAATASATNTNNFKPSYKLPDLEHNFTPIQTVNGGNLMPNAAALTAVAPNVNSIASSNLPQPTPVLMQYLPQAMPDNGVHYLQLIPTRPLIVPISPYLNGNTAPSASQPNSHALHPPLAAAINGGPLHNAVRTPVILTSESINGDAIHQQQQQLQQQQQHPAATAALIDVSNAALPYGLQTYANAIQPYRSSYRINREAKGKNFPATMTLNMNEYIPGPNEALRPLYMRGRP
ncbi:uncharacterized protein LOC128856741 [Anastrepha ludens]|uniref:uncharacterized protein LOC128856741 n=1 Tax=Anastrepha ludens TaxID=28586 RepID=UPI0023B0EF00|nr:uncharacterized protein LOC128856741 [Anastrepha ludens]